MEQPNLRALSFTAGGYYIRLPARSGARLNKTGTSKVGAISKAQKAQSF